jgi:hypothetical protein
MIRKPLLIPREEITKSKVELEELKINQRYADITLDSPVHQSFGTHQLSNRPDHQAMLDI